MGSVNFTLVETVRQKWQEDGKKEMSNTVIPRFSIGPVLIKLFVLLIASYTTNTPSTQTLEHHVSNLPHCKGDC